MIFNCCCRNRNSWCQNRCGHDEDRRSCRRNRCECGCRQSRRSCCCRRSRWFCLWVYARPAYQQEEKQTMCEPKESPQKGGALRDLNWWFWHRTALKCLKPDRVPSHLCLVLYSNLFGLRCCAVLIHLILFRQNDKNLARLNALRGFFVKY